jgi:hypothetical protein
VYRVDRSSRAVTHQNSAALMNLGCVCSHRGREASPSSLAAMGRRDSCLRSRPRTAQDCVLRPTRFRPPSSYWLWGTGDEAALNQVILLMDDELRRVARMPHARKRAGHSLQATRGEEGGGEETADVRMRSRSVSEAPWRRRNVICASYAAGGRRCTDVRGSSSGWSAWRRARGDS